MIKYYSFINLFQNNLIAADTVFPSINNAIIDKLAQYGLEVIGVLIIWIVGWPLSNLVFALG